LEGVVARIGKFRTIEKIEKEKVKEIPSVNSNGDRSVVGSSGQGGLGTRSDILEALRKGC